MAKSKNYLIGNAQELAGQVPPPGMNPDTTPIYTLNESLQRLHPQFNQVSSELSNMRDELCPRDYSVAKLTLHPSFIAKGHFPSRLLREMGARSIGSKADEVLPDKWSRKGTPVLSPTTSIFIATQRRVLADFSDLLAHFREGTPGAGDLEKIWSIQPVSPTEKLRTNDSGSNAVFEVGLQLIPDAGSDFIKKAFLRYADSLGVRCRDELSVEVSNLWFVPVEMAASQVETLAEFSFVRVVRPMPTLRSFRPVMRSGGAISSVQLPIEPPLAADVRVALLDGGLPDNHDLQPWVNNYVRSDAKAADCDDGPVHGLGVTSAFLFGPLGISDTASRPYSAVDHHRVLDSNVSGDDPLELYRTLAHIEDILISRQYEFINISLGPNLPIDDDEIHPWTSLIDSYLADGDTLVTVAAGNNGELDQATGLNRVQVPSDCVNAVTVGAADRTSACWGRATYSAIGPGRAPGRVKPDLLDFGGSPDQYFHVLSPTNQSEMIPQQGTSFAAPYLLRKAVGIRALFGHGISPLAIKALLINAAEQGEHEKEHVGWGRVPGDISHLIESPPGVAKILYQGELNSGKYLRVPLPIPEGGIKGKVAIKATCCFATTVDPQDTSMYTKAGVQISWYPKKDDGAKAFFQQQKIATEAELRRDAAKWEPVLHAESNKIGSSLDEPAFKIHYMARDGGAPTSRKEVVRYAFVVTLECKKHEDIFSDILNTYPDLLTEIQPRVVTDVQVKT